MRTTLMGLFALASLASAAVHAEQVTCESKGKQRSECAMDTQGDVRIVRQLSKTKCDEGVTWGLSKHAVWVEGGCRAVFENVSASAPAQTAASGGIPLLNASCPTGIDVHADEGGPIYINGNEAALKRFNDNYFEARDAKSGTVVSLTRRPDGSMDVSYTAKGGANGVCALR